MTTTDSYIAVKHLILSLSYTFTLQIHISELAYVPDCPNEIPSGILHCNPKYNRDQCGFPAKVPEPQFQADNDTITGADLGVWIEQSVLSLMSTFAIKTTLGGWV